MMNQAILVAFKLESDRDEVRRSLENCGLASLFMPIKVTDSFENAMHDLKSEEFTCAFIEYSEQVGPEVIDAIGTPIIFVVDDNAKENSANLPARPPHVYCNRSELNLNWLNTYLPLLLELRRVNLDLLNANEVLEQSKIERDLSSLTSWHYRTTTTAQMMGMGSVRESSPELFDELVEIYRTLMDVVLEERTFKIPAISSEKLHRMSQQLGVLNAGPRDVIELYATALKKSVGKNASAKSRALSSCGQMLALELMGYLVSFYRNLVGVALQPFSVDDQGMDQ